MYEVEKVDKLLLYDSYDKKLSYRREADQCFVKLNISPSLSLKVIRNDTLEYRVYVY